ncbi:MAG: aryl-sulfate sulfotransferase [Rikenellaceae bacterium]
MKTKITTLLGVLLIASAPQNNTFAMAEMSDERSVGAVLVTDKTTVGYTLFSTNNNTSTYLIDCDGALINEWESNYKVTKSVLLENGILLRALRISGSASAMRNPISSGRLEMLNWDGTVIWSWDYLGEDYLLHHDFTPIKQADGSFTILASSWELFTKEEAIEMGRDPRYCGGDSGNIWMEKLIEIKPMGSDSAEIIWQWRMADHLIQDLDKKRANYGVVANNPQLMNVNYFKSTSSRTLDNSDWNHVSGIAYNPTLDQIAIANHGTNEVLIINHSTTTAQAAGSMGDIIYRWGNPAAYNKGDHRDCRFSALHAVCWIPKGCKDAGKIMVFNNGVINGASSVDILDSAAGEICWSYSNGKDFFSREMGNGIRLENGNTIINEGSKGTIFEINTEGEIVWKYINPVIDTGALPHDFDLDKMPTANSFGDWMNATYKIEWYSEDYAGLEGRDLTPDGYIENYKDQTPKLKSRTFNRGEIRLPRADSYKSSNN